MPASKKPAKPAAKQTQQKALPPHQGLSQSTLLVLCGLLAAWRVRYALNAAVEDCDETFNYWEPLHQVVFKRGLQTWEYSPDFALRGWTYILLHSAPVVFLKMNARLSGPILFAVLRCLLCVVASFLDTFLVSKISQKIGHPAAFSTFLFLLLSPGCTQASFAFLPSAFSLMCMTFTVCFQLDLSKSALLATPERILNDHRAVAGTLTVLGVVTGVILGWPFVGLIGIPIALHTLKEAGFVLPFLCLVSFVAMISGAVYLSDRLNYGVNVFSTWELVKYNVLGCLPRVQAEALGDTAVEGLAFPEDVLLSLGCVRGGGEERGSHLYGVEGSEFFFVNLALNFNVVFAAGLVAPAVLLVFAKQNRFLKFWLCIPFTVWFAFWLLIPHKEERFMQPVYSILCLSAGLLFGEIWTISQQCGAFIRFTLKSAVLFAFTVFTTLSVARLSAVEEFYGKPILDVMKEVAKIAPRETQTEVVCLGSDWYRFTSHFFVPKNVTVGFRDTGFGGLLPKYFGARGTKSVPEGMNDLNQADPKQFTELSECTYVVASGEEGVVLEGGGGGGGGTWEVVAERKMVNRDASSSVARAFKIADALRVLLPSGILKEPVFQKIALYKRV